MRPGGMPGESRSTKEKETVLLEHSEVWHFETGDVMRNRFVTIHVVENGKIKLWRNYWDLNTMLSQAPQSWLEHLASCNPDEWSLAYLPAVARSTLLARKP